MMQLYQAIQVRDSGIERLIQSVRIRAPAWKEVAIPGTNKGWTHKEGTLLFA